MTAPVKKVDLHQQVQGFAEVVENFRRLQNFIDQQKPMDGFSLLSFDLPAASGQVKMKHGLTFIPKDVILARLLAPSGAKLIVHHGLFDRDNIVVSATGGDLQVRLLVGSYQPQSGADSTVDSTATQVFKGPE